jgi:Tetratricopeptide repeat
MGTETPTGQTEGGRFPARPSVTGSIIFGDNTQILAGGDVVVVRDRPAYRLEVLRPAIRPNVATTQQPPLPSVLLDAQQQVVPYWPRAELAQLENWRDYPTARMSLRLVHGPGGQGKTRLASRFASGSHAAGWTVAQALDKQPGVRGGPRRVVDSEGTGDQPLLVVVDYAERWRLGVLVRLVEDLEVDYSDRRVRVLILARPGELLWQELRAELGRSTVEMTEPIGLGSLTEPNARRLAFDEAVAAFTRALHLPPESLPPPPDLAHPDMGVALTLHMAALAAVCARRDGTAIPGREDLSTFLLEHEQREWTRTVASLAADARHDRISVATLRRAVAVATLFGPLEPVTGREALRHSLVADTDATAERVLAVHELLYPAAPSADTGNAVGRDAVVLLPLRPDRLGEDFLAAALRQRWGQDLTQTLFTLPAHTKTGGVVLPERRGLTVLAVTGQRHSQVAAQLFGLLNAQPRLMKQASADVVRFVVEQAPDELLPVVETALPRFDTDLLRPARDLALRRLETLPASAAPFERADALIRAGVRLAEAGDARAALAPTRKAMAIFRRLAEADPAYLPALATALSNLGNRLLEVGDQPAALATAGEATDLYRRLAEADPTHLPDLATALTNLSGSLSRTGDKRAALATAGEATDLYRRLAEADPTHLPGLATALNNLGAHLSGLGDRRAALATASEATDLYRQLAQAQPAVHLPGLATALNNLAISLSGVGDTRAALTPCQEAVDIYRRLAQAEPAAYLPTLATALINLGHRLSGVGDKRAALTPCQEAVDICRRLAQAEPAAHLSDLGMALNSVAISLSEVGDKRAALAPSQEAVDIYRRLAEAEPAAHLSDLARALISLGNRLSGVGDKHAALAATQEAVQIRRRLVEAEPAAYLPELAKTLNNLGNRLSGVGDKRAALAPSQEAADIYRRLAKAEPAAYLPELAMALTNLGVRLSEVGNNRTALAPSQEAADIYRQLAQAQPAVHLPALAGALNNLGVHLSGVGDNRAALASIQEAVDIYRRLAQAEPAAYLPTLARMLNNLGNRLSGVGDNRAALASIQEAVDIYRRLAQAEPAAYLPEFAMTLNNLGISLSEVDEDRAALAPTREAATLYRLLAKADPSYLPNLAMAQTGFAWVRVAGRIELDEASVAIEEAVALYADLAKELPDVFSGYLDAAERARTEVLKALRGSNA